MQLWSNFCGFRYTGRFKKEFDDAAKAIQFGLQSVEQIMHAVVKEKRLFKQTFVLFISGLFILCTLGPETVNPLDYPPVIAAHPDTTLLPSDSLRLDITGTDRNGAVVMFYYDFGGNGWDDSSAVPFTRYVKYPAGGAIKVIRAARDNENVWTRDTFTVTFGRYPNKPVVFLTLRGDTAVWDSYDSKAQKGSLKFTFSATDPDGDSITYSLLIGKDSLSTPSVYSGSTGTFVVSGLDTSSLYYWKVITTDATGLKASTTGSFRTLHGVYIPVDGLVAYYPFNGNARDESGNGNDGVNYGTISCNNRFGNQNAAIFLNGTSDYIRISKSNLQPPYTVSAWINKSGNKSTQTLLGSGNSLLKIEQYDKTYLVGFTKPYVKDYCFNYSLPTGTWVHLVWRFSTNACLYVNSIAIDSVDAVVPCPFETISSSNSMEAINGSIDDVRIYNRALTDREILQLYHEGGWTGQ